MKRHDMRMATRQKFATQVEAGLLAQTREIAESEGRQIQSVVEEALEDLIKKKKGLQPRPEVLAAYEASVQEYQSLYERLAK